ncbi:MAG: cytochrome b/b6 domain-containing protein [Hyphomicrobiaceae bacterium]
MLYNTRASYGLITQLIHWVMAALILILIPLGIYMHELPADTAAEAAGKSWYYSLHKTLGVTALLIAVVRVAWTVFQPHPQLLNVDRKWESLAARSVHWMLYGAIIAMPLTGWLYHSATEGFAPIWWPFAQGLPFVGKDPGLAAVYQAAHFLTGVLLGACLLLHVGGAIKHAVIDRDDTLRRMVPGLIDLERADAPVTKSDSAPRPRWLPAIIAMFAFVVLGCAAVFNVTGGAPGESSGSVSAQAGARPAGSAASGWQVDKDKSRLEIQIIQSGKPIAGHFQSWTATIVLDPDNLPAARIDVAIDVASLALGSVSSQAVSSNFLNAADHPTARFISRAITNTGTNAYEARGELTLAGQTRPLTLPFKLTISGTHAAAGGEVSIDRLAFGVGSKGFSDSNMLGLDVRVRVMLEATRLP